jgi:thiamine-phosphate pyrophosphorylase
VGTEALAASSRPRSKRGEPVHVAAMPNRCLLYYVTDRAQFQGSEEQRRSRLLEKIAEAASLGIDYIQLREKDLSTCDLEILAREVADVIRKFSKPVAAGSLSSTRLLINSRIDVALAVGAAGVHLRSDDLSAQQARQIWNRSISVSAPSGQAADKRFDPLIAVSCHSVTDVARAQEDGADFAVVAPVFEKKGKTSPAGLDILRDACQHRIPVLALGGATLENASACLQAGAAGIAAIRLFQENDVGEVINKLRLPPSL